MSRVKGVSVKKTKGAVSFADPHHDSYFPTEGWKSTAPEMQGMDSNKITATIEAFQHRNVHSTVIIRNGYLVAECYKDGTDANTLQDVRSVTKSITASLTGIALSEYKLRSVEQTISEWLPSIAAQSPKNEIMIKHLLNMTSGLEWEDREDLSSNGMMYSSDWVQTILEHRSAHKPGTKYNYSNGDAHLLSAVLHKAVKQSLFDYAKSRLLDPLGITNVQWASDPQGYSIGA